MNTRIFELARQAGFEPHYESDGRFAYSAQCEKLVELIVRECMDVVRDINQEQACPYCNFLGAHHCGKVAAAIIAGGATPGDSACSNAQIYGMRNKPELLDSDIDAALARQPLTDEQKQALWAVNQKHFGIDDPADQQWRAFVEGVEAAERAHGIGRAARMTECTRCGKTDPVDLHMCTPVSWLRGLLDSVMTFRHDTHGMVRGGDYVRADALIEAATHTAPQVPGAPARQPTDEQIDAAILAEANRLGAVAEMCDFVDYDPEIGRVQEHWVPSLYSRAAARAVLALRDGDAA